MASATPNVLKSSVILEKSTDWHEWMIVINLKAESGEVKELINPELTTEPAPLREPDRPKPSDIKQGVTSTTELSSDEREEFRFRRDDYKIELAKYRRQREALNSIKDFIVTSVARQHLSYLREKTTVYQMLVALKKRIAPTDRARKMELVRKYREIQRGPVNQQIDHWILEWEKICTDAEQLNIAEVQEERPLYDFLNAIRYVDAGFVTGREGVIEERIRKNEGLPTVHDMIEEYRNHLRILQVGKKSSYSSTHTAFATFQGEPSNGHRTKRDCLCGEVHSFKQCPYMIEGLRTAGWTPNERIEKEIEEKLSKIPQLKAAVERAQKEMKDSTNERKLSKPSEKNKVSNTLGAFYSGRF